MLYKAYDFIVHVPSYVYRAALNLIKKQRFRKAQNLALHLGCGEDRIAGFVNVDGRYTKAVDLTLDLTELRDFTENVNILFSNAFFEHLSRSDHARHLQSAYRALTENGFVCYIGIPNFAIIADAYLKKAPGTAGPVFDLYNVYRYTHGDPEGQPWYFEQLHKYLFDHEELKRLLEEAGFKTFAIFEYAYPSDVNPVPVNLGFYAPKKQQDIRKLKNECLSFLKKHQERVLLETVRFY